MRHAILAVLAAILIGSGSGCHIYHQMRHKAGCTDGACAGGQCHGGACGHAQHCACGGSGCENCRDGHCDPHEPFYHGNDGPPQRGGVLSALHGHGGVGGPPSGAQPAPGPSAAQVSYPYYTTRGPRDFLAPNPRGIGP